MVGTAPITEASQTHHTRLGSHSHPLEMYQRSLAFDKSLTDRIPAVQASKGEAGLYSCTTTFQSFGQQRWAIIRPKDLTLILQSLQS